MDKDQMTKIDPKELIDKCLIEIKYCDSEGLTIPMIMTEERLKKVYDDLSIEKIKLTTDEGQVFELDLL